MCLYKCNSYYPSLLFVALFIILLCIGSHGVYVLSNMHNPFMYDKSRGLRWGCGELVVAILGISVLLFIYIGNYKQIYMKYKGQNDISVVQGTVENIVVRDFLSNGCDEFTINGIKFCISDEMFAPGYQRRAANGGVITTNGISLKVVYIHHNGKNYIMEIYDVSS